MGSGPEPAAGTSGREAERGPAWPPSRRVWSRTRHAWGLAWRSFVPLVPRLLLGTAIAAAVRGFMPVDWILAVAGPDQPGAIPLMAAIGLPLYINAEILLPIAATLVNKGIGIGAVLALVIVGLGMSASEIPLLTSLFRTRLIAALVLSYFALAVGVGMLASTVAG